MAKVDNPGIWEKIQKNVQETERLMGHDQGPADPGIYGKIKMRSGGDRGKLPGSYDP